jgi:hypothetical protein
MKQYLHALIRKPRVRKVVWIFATSFVFLLILFFSFRNMVLRRIVNNKIEKFNNTYPAKLTIDKASFSGLITINLRGIQLIPDNKDTLFTCSSLSTGLKLFPLLFGSIKISSLELDGTRLNIIARDSLDNYSFLFSQQSKQKTDSLETNYSMRLSKLSNAIFTVIPGVFSLKNFMLNATLDSNVVSMRLNNLKLYDNKFISNIYIEEGKKKETLIAQGNIDKSLQTLGLKLYADTGKFTIPVCNNRWGLLLAFDTLNVGISSNTYRDEEFRLHGYAAVSGLLLNHRRISLRNVNMDKAAFDFQFRMGEDFVELDSSSVITYNKFSLNPYALFKHAEAKQFTLKINNEFLAQDFFSSLPDGLFTNFEGIKTEGKLKLFVDFFVDMKQPDSLSFDASLTGKHFKVTKYGVTDFALINAPFTFTAYENGQAVKSLIMGGDDPEFTPLDDISTYLREAVMVSENGGYYFSSGFDVGSLRLALIDDIKQRRFVRGGSTIEMQLVRNVFLNRNKTMARKIEELLIVWLMQTGNLCDKDRMFEVYLNVAEWGPGIYGISEAAAFYFRKQPSQLSLAESIFLASILPKPKWFKYSFDKSGSLIPEQNQFYFSNLASILLKKEVITDGDTLNLLQKVKLKGESRIFLEKDTANYKLEPSDEL